MACTEPTFLKPATGRLREANPTHSENVSWTEQLNSPLFLQQFAVALPPLLVDGVGVEYGQADDDESDGGGRDQHLQGQVHLLRLGATSCDVAGETVRGEAETERKKEIRLENTS